MPRHTTTIATLLRARSRVAWRECEDLLAHVLRTPREHILAHPELPVSATRAARFRALVRARTHGLPLAQLLGTQWFYGRPFRVTSDVLIPRPETELLVEMAIRECKKQKVKNKIIDVGTGSGCVAVTMAAELPHARVIATDTSPAALRIARANARAHGVANRTTFLRGDLLTPLLPLSYGQGAALRVGTVDDRAGMVGRWPSARAREEVGTREHAGRARAPDGEALRLGPLLILANLPYLTTDEWHALPPSLKHCEPRAAFDGGPDGLVPYRALFTQLDTLSAIGYRPAPARTSGLSAILEIDPRRKRALAALVRRMLPDWRAVFHRDLAGRWRVLELHANG